MLVTAPTTRLLQLGDPDTTSGLEVVPQLPQTTTSSGNIKYFCKYRLDLKEQRRQLIARLEDHVADVQQKGLMSPTPAELESHLPVDAVDIDDETQQQPQMVEWRDVVLRHDRDKLAKNSLWQVRQNVARECWIDVGTLLDEFERGGVIRPPRILFMVPSAHVNDSWIRQYMAMAQLVCQQLEVMRSAGSGGGNYLMYKQQVAATLKNLAENMSRLYHNDVEQFKVSWSALPMLQERFDQVTTERDRHLRSYLHERRRVIMSWYARAKQRLLSAPVTITPLFRLKVRCRFVYEQQDEVPIVPNETVQQFKQRVLTSHFHMNINDEQYDVAAFIISGPRMADRALMSSFALTSISFVKLVLLNKVKPKRSSSPRPSQDRDDTSSAI